MRNYGRITTSIWRDDDFRGLSSDARFTYVMLVAQANVSACGVLELTERRWAGHLGFDVGQLGKALAELEAGDYVLVDEITEELFVRSFVKWDGGAGNDLRRKAIASSAGAVASPLLRASIAVQLDRMNVPHSLSIPVRGPIEGLRVVDDLGESVAQPLSTSHEREPDDLEPPSMFCSEHPTGTEKPCGPCGGAKLRRAEWDRRTRQKLTDAAAVRRGCGLCDENGMRLDGDGFPAGRCDHKAEP